MNSKFLDDVTHVKSSSKTLPERVADQINTLAADADMVILPSVLGEMPSFAASSACVILSRSRSSRMRLLMLPGKCFSFIMILLSGFGSRLYHHTNYTPVRQFSGLRIAETQFAVHHSHLILHSCRKIKVPRASFRII